MAKKNAYKSYRYGYGKSFYGKAQDFGDYIERVVGEINIKFVSIVITNIFMSGEYGQELEKKKFEDRLPRQSALLRRPCLERWL